MSLGKIGPRLTDEYVPIEEQDDPKQMDFDEIWADKLRKKYGIKEPFAD